MSDASLFYGAAVPARWDDAADEGLTRQEESADLVQAHLLANYSYFGAIDKTLSGFFVLSDEDDNYYLADLREPGGRGQVYFQDHETRELAVEFDSVDDYVRCREELAAADEEEEGDEDEDDDDDDEAPAADRDAIRARHQAAPRPSALVVPTAQLLARYQWLVWLLAQPLRDRADQAMQSDEELTRSAARHFAHVWPDEAQVQAALTRELPLLSGDVHLAIYWLLHAVCTGDDAEIGRAHV